MSKKILVVDDEPKILELIESILENTKRYSTISAQSGLECLGILDKQHVDLVILDIIMPQMDGWEVLRKLEKSKKKNKIPVVILTAKSHSIDKILALKVFGVKDFITKPFRVETFLKRISEVLDEH